MSSKEPSEAPLPPGLTLKQLLVVHRHGERVPVRHAPRIHGPGEPSFEQLWRQCSITPFIGALHSFKEHFEPALPFHFPFAAHAPHFPPPIGEIRFIQGDSEPLPPYLFNQGSRMQLDTANGEPGLCHPGQLTDMGKKTMLELGNTLRETYTDEKGFLPNILNSHFNKHNLYVRSSAYVRTIESVQYLLAGLFPFHTREQGQDIAIHIRAEENTAVQQRTGTSTTALMNKLTKAFPAGDGKKDGKKDDDFDVMSVPGEVKAVKKKPEEADRLKAYDIREIDVFFDTFKAMKAAGIPLPPGVSDKDVEELGTNFMEHFLGGFVDAATESISGTSTATTVKRLFTGRFIGDLLEVMDSRVQKPLDDEYSIKLGLFSGHDTTIGPLLTGMGLFNGERRAWPKFGANVTFELFENHVGALKAENDHFVRVKYNGVPMKLPFCQKQGAHFVGDPNLCSYKTFNNAMSLLVSKNHKEECRL